MRLRHPLPLPAAGLALALALAGGIPAAAAPPAPGADDRLGALIDELGRLIDQGERERLADPWFLRDLRGVLARYDYPWREAVLDDDFSARGPEPPPPWRVTRGEFRLDWRHGLRAVVGAEAPAPTRRRAAEPERKVPTGDDVAAALLGAILKQAIGGRASSPSGDGAPRGDGRGGGWSNPDAGGAGAGAGAAGEPAAVAAVVPIPNAFAIDVELSARPLAGVAHPRLELGPYQGADMATGYRLIHESGASPSFTLVSAGRRGVSTVDFLDRTVDLADGRSHRLQWTRDRHGRMQISLDGEVLFDTVDRRFRDPFDGLVVIDAAGDFALRRVRIEGAR